MGMMIRHNRLRKAEGAVETAPQSSVPVVEEHEDKPVEKTEKRGRRKQ